MFNFIVDDVAAMIAQVVEGGAKQVGEIVKESYGDFGWFTDPEGFKVELWMPKSFE
jgi:predicted enzyme related to lactoylglutathione lyase